VALVERHASERLGVCLDIGNNLSLLDDPREVVEKLAPHAVTAHIKDMAMAEYPEGFLLVEVPLGQGLLDLAWVVERIRQARPQARMSLEMITRDPLQVPCLTGKYWATFPQRNGLYLARALELVRGHAPRDPLPRVTGLEAAARRQLEEDNVRKCLAYAGDKLGLRGAGPRT
jgi:sugar phosphate isomerase/epimerase